METPGAAPAAPGPEPEEPTPVGESVTAEGESPAPAHAAASGEVLDPSGVPSLDEDFETEDVAAAGAIGAAEGAAERRGRFGRFRIGAPRVPRSRRGVFALLILVGGFFAMAAFSGATLIHWTETADFCGRCHQMGPELIAYETGPHSDVTCAECHVEPGIGGWIKAKVNGTKQLVQVITGLYPKPVPPPEHAALPSVDDTCKRCHSPDRFALSSMSMRNAYTEDEPNSLQAIALMLRPGGGDPFDVDRSVHWHVLQDVEYWAPEFDKQKIALVEITRPNGAVEEFIAFDQIEFVEDVDPEIEAIKAGVEPRRMDCIDCHNRVGHPIPNPRNGTDASITSGIIDQDLPYVKREAMRILWAGYPSVEVADQAAETLADFYELKYPEVAATQGEEIDRAIEQIKRLYRATATPEMKVTAATYPDNLGHMDFPGCFRCHDGGHFLVKNGEVTKQPIPASCDTCHTFPQIGGDVATLPLGEPPRTHDDTLWVFNHKSATTSTDPGGTTCGECHARDYCTSCHATGAVDVSHDDMLVNHAQIIREAPQGAASCTYCHQPVYCARCHGDDPVLPTTRPVAGGEGGVSGHVPLDPSGGAGVGGSSGSTGAASSIVHAIPSPPGIEYPLLLTGVDP